MPSNKTTEPASAGEFPELELSDADILDAMRHIPGYIDISTTDFRAIYHLAHTHALERRFGAIKVERLIRTGIEPLTPEVMLDAAARSMVRQGLKGLPVVDREGIVIGMLTETDFLHRLQAGTLIELLLRLIETPEGLDHRCHETPVGDAMTAPAVSVPEGAGFAEMIAAFHRHEGRGMPVVDGQGHLRGVLLRKDCISAFHLEDLL